MFFIIFSRVEVIVESTSSSIWIEKRFIHSFVFWSYWLKFKFILFSFQFICGNSVLLIVLIDFCACGTIQERPRGPTANTQTQKGNKKIMNPAFANAGQGKGLEIWRIEVSLILLFRDFISKFPDLSTNYSTWRALSTSIDACFDRKWKLNFGKLWYRFYAGDNNIHLNEIIIECVCSLFTSFLTPSMSGNNWGVTQQGRLHWGME